jgi:hypothetical protein
MGALVVGVTACSPKGHVSVPTFESGQYTFTNPKQAVAMLRDALQQDDTVALGKIFGPQSSGLISSGDDIADKASFKAFAQQMDENIDIVERENQNPACKNQQLAFLYVGEHRYPFPIALHKRANGWRFDTAVGKEEIINRRIGRNEIRAIEATQQIVRAQKSFYEQQGRQGPPAQYAQRLFSSPGKRNGLYWEKVEGQPVSPLGPAIAAASAEGYTIEQLKSPRPFYGYHFAILKKQGPGANGGTMNYVDEKGRMTKGFGLIAYPAKYGESGVMTFVTGPDGTIYQKNLGPKTESIARKITTVNPDASWIPLR